MSRLGRAVVYRFSCCLIRTFLVCCGFFLSFFLLPVSYLCFECVRGSDLTRTNKHYVRQQKTFQRERDIILIITIIT